MLLSLLHTSILTQPRGRAERNQTQLGSCLRSSWTLTWVSPPDMVSDSRRISPAVTLCLPTDVLQGEAVGHQGRLVCVQNKDVVSFCYGVVGEIHKEQMTNKFMSCIFCFLPLEFFKQILYSKKTKIQCCCRDPVQTTSLNALKVQFPNILTF